MKKILLIDDNQIIRENTAEILTLSGYDVLTAENGKQGVEAALRDTPDLVICDIMMPDLDGYGVLHLLKRNPASENIPFIFLTAKTEREDFRRGMEMGADDYVTKPFDDVELLKAVEIRFRKEDIIQKKYSNTREGINDLIKNLEGSGLMMLEPSRYENRRLLKKQFLYYEGNRPMYLFFIIDGKVKTYKSSEDGKEYITNLYSAGDYMGYINLLEESNYEDTAVILEDATIALIPKEDFLKAIYNDISIASRFIKIIANDVKEKEERLLRLAYDTLRRRVAIALVEIHNKFNKNETTEETISISREDIAQYVGAATESLIRTLADLKSEKLVEIKEGKIRIMDMGKLKNLSC